MIVRTKGIEMKAQVRVDDEGYHVFALDDEKHDWADVLNAAMRKLGAVPMPSDPKFDALMLRRKLEKR